MKGTDSLKNSTRIRPAPRYRLGLPASAALAVGLTGVITLLCLWIQPNSLRAVLRVLTAQPLLIVLNCVPIGALVVAFAFLFRNVFSSACLVGACCACLSMANTIKLQVRDEPVFPRDFALLKEVGSAVGTYDIHWPWGIVAVIAVFLVVTGVCARLVGCQPFPLARLRTRWGRLLGFFGSLAVLIGLLFTVYASNALYNSFTVSNPYYVPAVFNELGFPYCFCHSFTTYAVDRPEGFSRAVAETWDAGGESGAGKAVHVVMVMNEAFSDLTDSAPFTWAEGADPLQNFHTLQADPHALSGHVVVPGFAGGTANTEFDVLTGMQTNALSAATTSAFRAVNRNLDSLFRVFAADGYRTSFLHPGDAWFYNRENVYRWLGAEDVEFAADMDGLEYKGRWVTDDSLARMLEDRFRETVAVGDTLFSYVTTIQNHMSYTADKYGPDYSFPPVDCSASLSDQTRTLLEVYTEGVRDADAMLGRLTAFFSRQDEPVVLVFWGDHLPYLGDGQQGYNELGLGLTPEENGTDSFLRSYETPYLLWANDAAASALDWERATAALDLPDSGVISACYLGSAVLELTGRGAESPWFAYLNQVRRELPVLQKQTVQTGDGAISDGMTEEQAALVSRLRQWSYYKLKYKDVS